MKLSEYLRAHNLKAAEFAERIGVHRSTVGRWIEAGRRPQPEHMALVRRETDGAVTANDFDEADDDEEQTPRWGRAVGQ